jgi:hypothetical protein
MLNDVADDDKKLADFIRKQVHDRDEEIAKDNHSRGARERKPSIVSRSFWRRSAFSSRVSTRTRSKLTM